MSTPPDAQQAWTSGVDPQITPIIGVEQPAGFVYHYTSAAGLVGIIDSRRDAALPRNLMFYASDVLGMNDISELAFGLEIVQGHVNRLAQGPTQPAFFQQWQPILAKYLGTPTLESLQGEPRPCVCAASFTTSDDLLSQWVAYGTGGGFAIGLDAQVLREGLYTGRNVRTGEVHTFKSALNRVYYGEQARSRVDQLPLFTDVGATGLTIASALQMLLSGAYALGDWLKDPQHRLPADVTEHARAALAITIAAQYKHQAFEAENEWRLLVGGGTLGDLTRLLSGHFPPNFRASGTRVLPYRSVTVSAPEDGPVIRDLVVGPAPDQVPLVHAAQQLLSANGHDASVVRPSTIPYRGW